MTAPRRIIAVAVSGGRDSTALLHAMGRQAREQGVEVLALHVHHGLQNAADGWVKHLQRQIQRWARAGMPIEFEWTRLVGQPQAGDSLEAWARRERYAALARMARAHGADCIALAHHRQDQAETVLLQALRGGGPRALAAMPAKAWRHGVCWARPWLSQSPAAIEAYVNRWRLMHISDPSNADPRFARNRLRLQVWPRLSDAFPEVDSLLSQVAVEAQRTMSLVDEIAAHDLRHVALENGGLSRSAWCELSDSRRHGVLHAWLARQGAGQVTGRFLDRLMTELSLLEQARWPLSRAMELRLYRDSLTLTRTSTASQNPQAAPSPLKVHHLRIEGPGDYRVAPWQGVLRVRPCTSGGLQARAAVNWELRPRRGGEQFLTHQHGVRRSLKKCFQSQGVPAWERLGPLVWEGASLLYVPSLGIDAAHRAPEGVSQWQLEWLPIGAPM